jgi:UDP-3-O-[3-hydroxymyristoyl] glucosamine N-acyltransferase
LSSAGGGPSYRLAEIATHVGGSVEGSPDVSIRGVAGIEEAVEGQLTFVANPKYRGGLATTKASAVLLAPGVDCPERIAVVRTADPYAAMMRTLLLFDPGLPEIPAGVHPTAVVAPDARLGDDVGIGPHVVVEAAAVIGRGSRIGAGGYVGQGARLGEACHLYPRVYVGRQCVLGSRVVIHAGTVIGSDGFGYAPIEGHFHKIPQIGIVEIADDVEIGANACIDRATFGKTSIGRGTKIDNLVQIAHNVAIAENCALAAQAGVAGSVRIGTGVRLGGQAGLAGHLQVGDFANVAAQGGVIGNVPSGATVSGYPARPHREAMRAEAALRKLPELLRRVRALERERDRNEESNP